MKTLFDNLLLTNRLVYMVGGFDAQKNDAPQETETGKAKKEIKAETPEAKAKREADEAFDDLLKNVEQRDKALSAVRKVVDKTEEVGGVEKDKTKKQWAELDIDKYLEKPGSEKNPIKLETMYVAGKVDKGEKGKVTKLGETKISVPKNDPNILEGQRYQKTLADVTDQLQKAEAEGSRAFFDKYTELSGKTKNRPLLRDAMAEYRAKNAETVKNNLVAALNATEKGAKVEVAKAETVKKPKLYTAEEIWGPEKATKTEVAKAEPAAQPESQVDAVQARAKEMLAKTQPLREKTVAAINKYAYMLDRVSSNIADQLIYNIKSANRDMIDRGASYKALTNFNEAIVAMVNQLPKIKDVEELTKHAQKIATEISDAKLGRKYEDKVQYGMYLERNYRT